jgi:hypothetical protein
MDFLSKFCSFCQKRRVVLKFSLHEFLVEIVFLLSETKKIFKILTTLISCQNSVLLSKTKEIFKILTTLIYCRNSVSSVRSEENFWNSYYINFLSKFWFFWQKRREFLKLLIHEFLVEILFLLSETKKMFKILTTWISCRNSVILIHLILWIFPHCVL